MTGMFLALLGGKVQIVTDPYYEYTTLLLPGNGTNLKNNNEFLDSSSNAFTVTRNPLTGPNAPTQGTFSPFSQTGWGNYFSGSSALSTTSNAAFNFSTGSFTLECWFNKQGSGGSSDAVGNLLVYTGGGGNNSTWLGITDSGTIIGKVGFSGSWAAEISGGSVSNGTWNHVALVRNSTGNTLTLYLNGSSIASTTNSTDLSTYGTNSSIAVNLGSTRYFNGYISNARIVKGVAVYTGTFTPPTSALAATQSAGTNISAITGTQTSLLTCQSNRFIDNATANSGSGFAITLTGSPSVQAFSPFNPTSSWSATTNGGSGYFDGSGDYLTVASNSAFAFGTNNFAIAFWIYPTQAFAATGSAPVSMAYNTGFNISIDNVELSFWIAGTRITSSTRPTPNQWNYVVCTRQSGTAYVYINGTQTATGSLTGSVANSQIYIGTASHNIAAETVVGYLSGIRILDTNLASTVPTSPPTNDGNTKLLLNFTNGGIYDATSKNDLETVGDAKISTAQSKWGGSSMAFDGTGDYLQAPDTELLEFGSGDFTIETWVRFAALPSSGAFQTLISKFDNSTQKSYSFYVYNNAGTYQLYFTYTTNGSTNVNPVANGITVTTNTWYHYAVCRSGANLRMFIDGTQVGSTYNISTDSIFGGTYPVQVGASTASNVLNGFLQDTRVTKGYARYVTGTGANAGKMVFNGTNDLALPTAAFPTL